jgi:hypothetical protein
MDQVQGAEKRKADGGAGDTEQKKAKTASAPPKKPKMLFELVYADHGSKGRRQTMEDEHITVIR